MLGVAETAEDYLITYREIQFARPAKTSWKTNFNRLRHISGSMEQPL